MSDQRGLANWTPHQVQDLLRELREFGGDRTDVEVEKAAGGYPSLGETLCAFDNLPNGGLIVLGADAVFLLIAPLPGPGLTGRKRRASREE